MAERQPTTPETTSGQFSAQPVIADPLGNLFANLVQRGINRLLGDPVQEAAIAQAQFNAIQQGLQQGRTVEETGGDLSAIERVLPGITQTLIGAETSPQVLAARAQNAPIFRPDIMTGPTGTPFGTDPELLQQLVTGGQITPKTPLTQAGPLNIPELGVTAHPPSLETIRQRTAAAPVEVQENLGIPAIAGAQQRLQEIQEKRITRQQDVANAIQGIGTILLNYQGTRPPDAKIMLDYLVDKRTDLPDHLVNLRSARPGAGGSDGGITPPEFRQRLALWKAALRRAADRKLSPKEKNNYSVELADGENAGNISEAVLLGSQLQVLGDDPGTLYSTIASTMVFRDEDGSTTTLAGIRQRNPTRATAIDSLIQQKIQEAYGGAGGGTGGVFDPEQASNRLAGRDVTPSGVAPVAPAARPSTPTAVSAGAEDVLRRLSADIARVERGEPSELKEGAIKSYLNMKEPEIRQLAQQHRRARANQRRKQRGLPALPGQR